jgi:hypothetical protein
MAWSRKRAPYLALILALWLTVIFFLWMPGIGSVSIPHAHYMKTSYGILSYYIIEERGEKVIRQGIQPFNLLFTILITAVCTSSFLLDGYREFHKSV